ncbi:hypothetical protein Nepgr_001980 [Nepenthes gracilis]|uniref:Uncharacterized protein n=1 Tax=Nepenthes gracilis TaxID=150966 RepID=A0AAD3RXX1_NEPGR|nr:hypothetical protein Nepgr_001980 [Nepenthes gracilis]
MNFYNTRAHERTLSDLRASEPADPLIPGGHMSLDLELNLPCGSYSSMETGNNLKQQNSNCSPLNSRSRSMKMKNSGDTERSQLLSLSLEADQQEMVTTVCPRCHMLIMIYKSSPVCPNCKFVHPPDNALQIYLAQGLASFASCSN